MSRDTPAKSMSITTLLRHLLRYLRPNWKMAFVLVAGLLVEAGFDTFVKMSSKILIDEAIVPKRYDVLLFILGALAAGAVAASALSLGCDYLWARFGGRVMNGIRLEIFEHLQRLSMSFYARSQVGDLMSRFSSDVRAVETGLVIALPAGILALGNILFSAALLFRLEWRLATVTVIGLPLCLLGPRLLGPRAIKADYRYKQEEAALASMVQENIGAQAVVKAFGLQGRAANDFRQRLQVFFAAGVRSSFLSYLVQRTPNVAALLVFLVVLGFGAVLAFNGSLSVGSLVAFQVLLTGMGAAINSLTWVGPYLISSAGGMQRLREVLDEEPQVVEASAAIELPRLERAITFEDVAFRYTPEQPGLEHVNLRLDAGSRVAFVGASGSGKSTLVNLIMRFYDPQQGRVCFDGHDLRTVTQASLRAQMAVVFQDNFLFNIPVRENLRLGQPTATDADVETAAKLAEIHDFLMSLPDGYDTTAGERGARFSGGQRQRLALARALIRNPSVLLLDEATSALDPATEVAVNDTMARISSGRTVISITHRLASAVHADLIVVCDDGRIMEAGAHQALCRANGVYAQLWKKQSGLTVPSTDAGATVDTAWLKALPFLRDAADAVLDDMRGMFITERHAEDRLIVEEGDPGDKFYIIARGRVAVEKRSNSGGPPVVLEDGDYFGEIALIKFVPRTATVRTLTSCTFLTLNSNQFRTVMHRIPGFEKAMARRYAVGVEAPDDVVVPPVPDVDERTH
jgi:ATP-binding cassette subfamily B protein